MDAKLSRKDIESALLGAMQSAMKPMEWGKDDCGMWVSNIIKDVVGYDPVARFRGRYKTRIGAKRALGKGGLLNAIRNMARRHSWRRVNNGGEQVGDIGIYIDSHGTPSTVICRAPGWFVGRNEHGWTALPTSFVRYIWAVV